MKIKIKRSKNAHRHIENQTTYLRKGQIRYNIKPKDASAFVGIIDEISKQLPDKTTKKNCHPNQCFV